MVRLGIRQGNAVFIRARGRSVLRFSSRKISISFRPKEVVMQK